MNQQLMNNNNQPFTPQSQNQGVQSQGQQQMSGQQGVIPTQGVANGVGVMAPDTAYDAQLNLLKQQRSMTINQLKSGQTEAQSIQRFIDQSDAIVNNLELTIQRERDQASDYKKLWTDSNTALASLRQEKNYYANLVKQKEQNQLAVIPDTSYQERQQAFQANQEFEELKKEFSNDFMEKITSDKWQ